MTRTEARNEAFILVFEKIFSNESVEDIISLATDSRDFEMDNDGYIINAFKGVYENAYELDGIIEKYLTNWTIDRLNKVDQAILALGIYELMYTETPSVVAINEAIELSKLYSDESVTKMINGVLDKVYHEEEK